SHVRIGLGRIGDVAAALPRAEYFPPSAPEVSMALAQLPQVAGEGRDVAAAIGLAESFVTADIAKVGAGEVVRSRYIVFMLLGGPPSPAQTATDLATRVERLKSLAYEAGALEFRLHVGYLYYGPRSLDLGTDPFGCYAPPAAACSCGAAVTDPYCVVLCDLSARADYLTYYDAQAASARETYSGMAFVGNGTLREFPCARDINLTLEIANSEVQLVKKEIVAFNRNVRLTTGGPAVDSDGDGLTDEEEIAGPIVSDPTSRDTDGDGIGDRLELMLSPRFDPRDASDQPASCVDLVIAGVPIDRDLDFLNDCEEGILQTSRTLADTDGDGFTDYVEAMSGTVPSSADDRLLDFDADGVSNADEVSGHSNPRNNDVLLRDAEAYRSSILPLGLRTVATMEDPVELPAVSFVSASPGVLGGQAYLRWDPTDHTLAWSDTRIYGPLIYAPVPTPIENGSGTYELAAEARVEGELVDRISIEVDVTGDLLPPDEVVTYPLISVAQRNCYDVRVSNIKVMQTQPSNGETRDGINSVLVFFTQAPSTRLGSPGITRVAELRVQYLCANPERASTCERAPRDITLPLRDEEFVRASQ
ncbi:MAG: hypothetical protein AAB426_04900, partial [Myxococcota bacterium]